VYATQVAQYVISLDLANLCHDVTKTFGVSALLNKLVVMLDLVFEGSDKKRATK